MIVNSLFAITQKYFNIKLTIGNQSTRNKAQTVHSSESLSLSASTADEQACEL